jgi:hypothetical protein
MVSAKRAVEQLASLLPEFQEEDQLYILHEVGLESSLNTDANELTAVLLSELRWMTVLYEAAPEIVKPNRADSRRCAKLQTIVWDLACQFVEYGSFPDTGEFLLQTLDFAGILIDHALRRHYVVVVRSGIALLRSVGSHRGASSETAIFPAADECRERLLALREQIAASDLRGPERHRLVSECDRATAQLAARDGKDQARS